MTSVSMILHTQVAKAPFGTVHMTLRNSDIQIYKKYWRENMLGYLSADIMCSEKRTVLRERSSRKSVSFEEQIMSKDKYPSIFSPQIEAIVFIILQIVYATRAVLKIGGYLTIIRQSGGE